MKRRKESRSHVTMIGKTEEPEGSPPGYPAHGSVDRGEILLRALELLGEYDGLEHQPESLESGLRRIEKEALQEMGKPDRPVDRRSAIREYARKVRFADEVMERYRHDRSMVIQILLEIQNQEKWISRAVLRRVSERLHVPLSRLRHVTSFYTAFNDRPAGRHACQVCTGTACHVRGSDQLLARVKEAVHLSTNPTDPDHEFSVKEVNCLGCCAVGPVMTLDGAYFSSPSLERLTQIFKEAGRVGEEG